MPDPVAPARLPLSPCSLAVFAPSPVLTITIERGGGEPEIHLHAGGQGFWAARLAARLGARVKLCAPLGGETGAVLRSLLTADGIELRAAHVEGSNGAYVHDRGDGTRRELAETRSAELRRHELDDLYGITLTAGIEAGAVLLTGPREARVLPAEIYERISRDLRRNGSVVLADLSGDPLVAALRGEVDLIKVSHRELIEGGWLAGEETAAIAAAARHLHEQGADNVLVTRGELGAVALLGDRLLEVSGPRFTALDEAGAGDSMFAGLGVGLGSGLSIEDALRVGAAAGALNVTRHGLGTGRVDEISDLAAQVRVARLRPDQAAEEGPAASTAS